MKPCQFVAALICLFGVHAAAFARGIGVESYFISGEGQLVVSLGETIGDLVDPGANVIFRYHDGIITAAALDKHGAPLWAVPAKPQIIYGRPAWEVLPKLIVVIGEDTISGLDRATGKVIYSTTTGNFTRLTTPRRSYSNVESSPENTIYLVNDMAQHQRTVPDKQDSDDEQPEREPLHAATLARFDLAAGKFVWKTPVVTPSGRKMLPTHIDVRGSIMGLRAGDAFYFDPETGKALEKAPVEAPAPAAPPRARVQTGKDAITFLGPDGKALWSVKESAGKGEPLVTEEAVLVPLLTVSKSSEDVKAQVLALNAKDGTKRWRYTLPRHQWTDDMKITVQAGKGGYLVSFSWLVLD